MRPAPFARPGKDVGGAVAIHIRCAHPDTTRECGCIGEETRDLPQTSAGETEGADVRAAARTGTGDPTGEAIAAHAPACHEDAAPEVRVVREEPGAKHRRVANQANHLAVRPPPGPAPVTISSSPSPSTSQPARRLTCVT